MTKHILPIRLQRVLAAADASGRRRRLHRRRRRREKATAESFNPSRDASTSENFETLVATNVAGRSLIEVW